MCADSEQERETATKPSQIMHLVSLSYNGRNTTEIIIYKNDHLEMQHFTEPLIILVKPYTSLFPSEAIHQGLL